MNRYQAEMYGNTALPYRWGIKDVKSGEWIELRGLYSSSELSAVESQCEQLNENEKPVRCVCGYKADNGDDLDQHILASMHSPEDHAPKH